MDKERELKEEEKNDQNPEQNTISPATEHLQKPEKENGKQKDEENTTMESASVEEGRVELVTEEEGNSSDETVVANVAASEDNVKSNEVVEENIEQSTPDSQNELTNVDSSNEESKAVKSGSEDNVVDAKAVSETKASSSDELDIHDHDNQEHEDDHEEEIDYSSYSKQELVEVIKAAGHADNVLRADTTLRAIKPYFDEIRDAERKEALDKFVAGGGSPDDFDFKNDELNTRFDANYRLIKDRKSKYYQEKEKQKEINLVKKQELLEQIREFVDSDETNISFDTFKSLQNEWKKVGQVPAAHNRTLWANYNALMDRFYDKRSIYFELKELDRKKNLEAKIELCERAEQLVKIENLKEGIAQLNELHEEYKHIGPVPNEEREALWHRFKAASDAVYERRKGYVEELKVQFEENLVKKTALCEEVEKFTDYNSDRIKEWNEKTKEILALQKNWEAIGGMPKEKGKEINKKFWSSFKTFFHNKGEFFKRLDHERKDNLIKKVELVSRAEEIKDSTDWIKTANEFKKLQKEWKEIGPVPEKQRNEIYKQFKNVCDHFFDQKRGSSKEIDKEYEANLKVKEEICNKINELAKSDNADLDSLRDLQQAFNDAGFVPKKSMSIIKSKYSEAVDRFINAIPGITNEERHDIRLENQLNKILNEPNAEQKIFRKEQNIRKVIGSLENDIALWKNNIEFFAQSKTADKLKDEFDEKIAVAIKELKHLKQQLRMLRSVH